MLLLFPVRSYAAGEHQMAGNVQMLPIMFVCLFVLLIMAIVKVFGRFGVVARYQWF